MVTSEPTHERTGHRSLPSEGPRPGHRRRRKRRAPRLSGPAEPLRRRRPSRWRKLGLQILAVVAFLVLAEVALRLAGVEPVVRDPYQGFSGFRPLFVPADEVDFYHGRRWRVTAPGKRPWFNAQRFEAVKPPGTFRIFTLGGSTTYGRPYDDALSFSAWMRELLPAADGSRDWEVINAGGISYASYRVAAVLEELTAYEPDLFVIYTGHNEFLEERTYRDVSRLPEAFRVVAGLFSRTSLYAVMRAALPGLQDPEPENSPDADRDGGGPTAVAAEVVTRLDSVVGLDAYERDPQLNAQVLAHYFHNLERMLDTAQAAGADVLFVTPAAALKDCEPFKSQPDDEHGRDADALYAAGLRDLEQGHVQRAAAALRDAKDFDVCPLRAPSMLLDSLRALATHRGVPLVDFEALLAERMQAEHGHPIPGAEWFLDHVHLTVEGNGLLAVAILERLADAGTVTLSSAFRDVIVPAVGARMRARLTPEVQGLAARNLAKVLSWSGQHERADAHARRAEELLGPGDSETQFLLGNHARARGEWDQAADRYRRATEIDAGYAEAFFNLADALLNLGRAADAVAPAARAAALLPDRAGAHELSGLALSGAGQPAAALAPLLRAESLDPDDPSPPNNRGLALIALGRAAEASEAFAEAVRRDPDYVKGHYNLGLARLARGDAEGAAQALRATLALDPDHARARARLSQITAGGSP